MTVFHAKQDVKRVQIGITVIRADGRQEPLGVVSDSAWWWKHGPGRWLAARRTRQVNARAHA
jgi:hypothetical protein